MRSKEFKRPSVCGIIDTFLRPSTFAQHPHTTRAAHTPPLMPTSRLIDRTDLLDCLPAHGALFQTRALRAGSRSTLLAQAVVTAWQDDVRPWLYEADDAVRCRRIGVTVARVHIATRVLVRCALSLSSHASLWHLGWFTSRSGSPPRMQHDHAWLRYRWVRKCLSPSLPQGCGAAGGPLERRRLGRR